MNVFHTKFYMLVDFKLFGVKFKTVLTIVKNTDNK